MASQFLMQIVDRRTGDVVQWEPGRVAEIDFVEVCTVQACENAAGDTFVNACVSEIVSRGVGFGRTSAHVAQDARVGIQAAIDAHMESSIRESLERAIYALKEKIAP